MAITHVPLLGLGCSARKIIYRIAILSFVLLIVPLARAKPDEDRREIRVAALNYLMLKHATFGKERQAYSYYALTEKEYVPDFRDFNPPVVAYDSNRFETKPAAVERKTGKSVKIWSVGEPKISGDHASVSVSWYAGNMAAGDHTVSLKKKHGVWIATSDRLEIIAESQPSNRIATDTVMKRVPSG